MRIGDLNQRITLQAPTRTADGMGGYTVAWTDQATLYAAVWPTSAKESVEGGALVQEITHRVRIRYRSLVLASWRVEFGSRYLTIAQVVCPNEGRRWLDLLCKEAKA